jgi:hypothetical protein
MPDEPFGKEKKVCGTLTLPKNTLDSFHISALS